jgi:hypothetical protein
MEGMVDRPSLFGQIPVNMTMDGNLCPAMKGNWEKMNVGFGRSIGFVDRQWLFLVCRNPIVRKPLSPNLPYLVRVQTPITPTI